VGLDVASDLTEPIYDAALTLLRRELHGQRIRLVGVTASNFRDRDQLALFEADDPRRHQAAEALDRIRRKYGERSVTRARLVRAALPAPFERDPMTAVERRHGTPEAAADSEGPAADRDSVGVTEDADDLDADA
jgi:hypothetical protein